MINDVPSYEIKDQRKKINANTAGYVVNENECVCHFQSQLNALIQKIIFSMNNLYYLWVQKYRRVHFSILNKSKLIAVLI